MRQYVCLVFKLITVNNFGPPLIAHRLVVHQTHRRTKDKARYFRWLELELLFSISWFFEVQLVVLLRYFCGVASHHKD